MTDDAQWWRTAVVYEIYPRSFRDSNNDGVGDLEGVRRSLPYLASLGVDAIWFTPWYVSPLADGGYDVEDYRAIDPVFGSIAEAEQLIEEARAVGIRTIVDVVPNHVSARHPWFAEALSAGAGSDARERFWFHPGRGLDGSAPPTTWKNNFGGPTWTRVADSSSGESEWYLHLFDSEQPDLNWNHPDVASEHESILRFWFDRGVAGIRVDSAAHIMKDPSLPEDDGQHHPGAHPNLDRDEVHPVYKAWRRVADEFSEPRILIGEVWVPDQDRFARYLAPDEFHTAFNFDLMARPWDAAEWKESIRSTIEGHALVGAPCTWVLSNHDVTRPATRFGRADSSFSFDEKRWGVPVDLELGQRRARAAALVTAALPGSLYIYQGDELGLPEVEDLDPAVIQDPMYFRTGGVSPGRDGCRVPIPWGGDAPPYGFSDSTTATWLPQPEGWASLTVEAQTANAESMLSLYRAALALRRQLLQRADPQLEWIDLGPSTIAFARGDFVSVTTFDAEVSLTFPHEVLLSSSPVASAVVPPDTTVWVLRT